jgi:protein-tyrosine phosphatase
MMFFKNKGASIDLGWLHADMHSHLVPGIDDGSPDIATSIALIKQLHSIGYQKLVTTPHILWEIYPNTTDIITKGINELRKAVQEEGIEIELHAAAEYFIDEHFEQELKNKTPLLTLSGNMVLVEFSMLNAPFDLQDVLFEMQMQNYQPVIAHPERYTYLARKKDFYDELKNAGYYFQLNLLALTGYYGGPVQELAEYLLKKNYYDFVGTDLHHERHLAAIRKISPSILKKLRDSVEWKNALL